jgi:hypothetical protein
MGYTRWMRYGPFRPQELKTCLFTSSPLGRDERGQEWISSLHIPISGSHLSHPPISFTHYFQRCGDQDPLPDAKRERRPMTKPRPLALTQKPARSADSAPVASSSRVQLSADRAISETEVAAFSQTQGHLVSSSPSSPTLPSRRKKDNERPHPYKHARPLSLPRIVVKRETTSAESDSTESNWLDIEMAKLDPEETKRGSYSQKIPFTHT